MKAVRCKYCYWLLPALTAAIMLMRLLYRELWCDEAITVMSFVEAPGIFGAYWNYAIANNHILYSLILKLWMNLCALSGDFSDLSYRIPSVLAAAGLFSWMFFAWRRQLGERCALILTLALVLTPAFAIYGTAVRGYMISMLFVFGAFEFARVYYFKGGLFRALGFFIFSLAAVAVMPSNLVMIAAIIFFTIWFRGLRKNFSLTRITVMGILPLLGFFLFYLPLWRQLLKNAANTTGWPNSAAALLCIYGSFVVCLAPVLIMFLRSGKFKMDFLVASLGVLLLPAAIIMLRHPAPFPRIFWPLWLIGLFGAGVAGRQWLQHKHVFKLMLAAVFVWGIVLQNLLPDLSSWLCGSSDLDDYFSPYYVKVDFRPFETLESIDSLYENIEPRTIEIYCSFGADPYSLLLYSRAGALRHRFNISFDSWRGKVRKIPGNSFIVVRSRNELRSTMQRFAATKAFAVSEEYFQKVYGQGN